MGFRIGAPVSLIVYQVVRGANYSGAGIVPLWTAVNIAATEGEGYMLCRRKEGSIQVAP